jgi:predicted DNA-binding transcriptional regulator AlpA
VAELLDIVQKFGEDVAVPKSPEPEGSPRLITIGQIAEEHGVSRSSVHTYRRSATFPQPVPAEGSTRIRYRADEVAAWFEANPPKQGKRTDLAPAKQPPEESRMKTYTVTMRIEADSDVTPEQVRQEIYDAGSDLPFGFDITSVEEG